MNFLRYRSEHLADHLRTALEQGRLAEPLPTLRNWSAQMGVSAGTLQAALKILKREGWIRSRPRQDYALARRPARRRSPQAPVVRWIGVGQALGNAVITEVFGRLSQKLAAHRIGFSMEVCGGARLRAIAREGERAHEMLLLSTDRRECQERLAALGNVLLFSPPAQGVRLSYIDLDVMSALRHAMFGLCRRGFDRIGVVGQQGKRSILARRREFERQVREIGAQAPRRIDCEALWLPEEPGEQQRAIQQLAARVRHRQGFITNAPVAPSLLMMALMQRGLKMPGQVEVVAVNCAAGQALTAPPVVYYPYPVEPFCKAVLQAALHYFDQGVLPKLRKLIPLQMVSPR